MVTVSVVVPVYSGEEYLERLVDELGAVRDRWRRVYGEIELCEAIFVVDAAIDGSEAVLERLQARHDWVQSVTLSRNFGQHPATICGILHSTGDWVVTLDEDLQHSPHHIEAMLRRAVTEHVDVVYGAPEGAVHGSAGRDLSSRMFKRLLAYLARNPVIRDFSSFRLCRGSVARAGASVAGHETYLDVSLTWFTNRFAFERMPMRDERYQTSGASGYNLGRLVGHARRLFVSSHTRIMLIAAVLGMVAILIAAFFGSRAVANALFDVGGTHVPGWPSLFVGILFFGGLTAFLLVLILEYVINIALHTQGKPTFFVVDRSQDREVARCLDHGHDDAPLR